MVEEMARYVLYETLSVFVASLSPLSFGKSTPLSNGPCPRLAGKGRLSNRCIVLPSARKNQKRTQEKKESV